jgi:hypothetical protein
VITAAELAHIPVFDGLDSNRRATSARRLQSHAVSKRFSRQIQVIVCNWMAENSSGLALSDVDWRRIEVPGLDRLLGRGFEAWTNVTGVQGEKHLEQLLTTTRNSDGGQLSTTRDADALFVMIGATANTSWLPETLERDDKGYVYTGRDLTAWPLDHEPFPLETSLSGIF